MATIPKQEPSKPKPVSAETILDDSLSMVFENLDDGVMIINSDGTLLKANPAALRFHGLYEKEALLYSESPRSHFVMYDFEYNEIPFNSWPSNRILKKETIENEKIIVVNKETGKKLYARFSGKPQLDESDNFLFGVLFIKDISEQVNALMELEKEKNNRLIDHQNINYIQQQLDGNRQLLQTIIDTIPVMIVIYDKRIKQVTMNKAVEEITGWNNEDIQNADIMELAYPDPEIRSEVMQYMNSLEPGFKDIIMRTKDGRDIETSWANVKISDGRQVGVGIDITQRKKLENDLIQAKEKAEKENKVQTAFIQNISHEVRTPMNSILGFSELLQKSVENETEKHYLDAITYNGQQLLRLINDIVDFSRLDNNEMTLSIENIHIMDLINQTQNQFTSLKKKYNKAHIDLHVNSPVENHKHIFLYTDLYRLQQVLTNLVSNALKYTEKGEVEVGYYMRKNKQDVLFYVKDTGIGIKKEDHDRVFRRFNRFHRTNETEFRGTGLGLAICKHLVELLGGKIWFESENGKGSVFYFSHPFTIHNHRDKKNSQQEEQKNDSLPILENSTILIAEDDEFSFKMLNYMLKETKAHVLHAETGQEAVDLWKNNSVDLVFLDINLPELNGYQVIKSIRSDNKTIPVIAQTASALPRDKKKSADAGFNHHVTKPISMSELYSVLNKYTPDEINPGEK